MVRLIVYNLYIDEVIVVQCYGVCIRRDGLFSRRDGCGFHSREKTSVVLSSVIQHVLSGKSGGRWEPKYFHIGFSLC